MNFLKKIGLEPFILALGAAIFLAWAQPSIGCARKPFSVGDAANLCVSAIFFFYGLRLSGGKLLNGLKNVRLHALVHLSTFAVFPIIVYSAMFACGGFEARESVYYLWVGAFFLASLPSTVSSSVVMVSIAGGNIPAAIFNASVSSLFGVFITPALMGVFMGAIHGAGGFAETVLKLVFQVLLPVAAGFMLNRRFGWFAEKYKRALRVFDESVIVAIVYASFCESFKSGMFDTLPLATIAELSLAIAMLFFAAMATVYAACRIMKFDRPDTITAVFCGSKKSLMHGSVMSRVLFGASPTAGVILLPTMLYHAFQLVVVSMIAKKLGAKK